MRLLTPVILSRRGRAAGLPRALARAALALLAALVLISLTALAVVPATGHQNDPDLYAAILDGVRYQGGYYQITADALRAGGHPLRPFTAVRLPTLATVQAMLPPVLVPVLLWTLGAAMLLAWLRRLAPSFTRPGQVMVVLLLAGGCAAAWQADLLAVHELWAGLFIALSLALHARDDWVAAIGFALAAMLIRETAALYALVMAGSALAERRRPEAWGWGAALGLFAVVLAVHAHAVGLVTRPLDPTVPDWTDLAGPGAAFQGIVDATVLARLPLALAAPLAALSMAGWAAWRDPLATRVLATLGAYLLFLSLSDTTATGALLIAPLALAGLAFVPDLLRDLAAAALDKRRITVRRVVR